MDHDQGPNGGLFEPFHLPHFEREQILKLSERSFGQNVADILNLLFSTKLSAWDIEMTIGRTPVRIPKVGLRILIGELFHNAEGVFRKSVNALAARLHPDGELLGEPSNWVQIGIRIATIFGIYGQLLREGQVHLDKPLVFAAPSGSFTVPMAAWYARAMGLPLGIILCGCNENGAPWELIHRGVLDTSVLTVHTSTPAADVALPVNLERLICATLGQDEALKYCWCCTEGESYAVPETMIDRLQKGMFGAVVSMERVSAILTSVYRSNQYILDPYAALAYGALSDFRSSTGSAATALLWMENSPLCNSTMVSGALGMSAGELTRKLSEK
jgi:threonine synthase